MKNLATGSTSSSDSENNDEKSKKPTASNEATSKYTRALNHQPVKIEQPKSLDPNR
jgi:hypothetical protein